ncbi:hypothetical protein IAQ67_14780 [Paenibacillus peoriae]|uniref:Uncharacterized protein n=1 Tax=Paenibacillus peoriae TaxID=59893 RepID=A0A7H0Y271_9BACL|nr:hypothetical protein [Paenibacillus peoriae]QNR65179.1 hypothetical protein IAQ67_14780 [Paenibacillus peoriae]
MPEFKMISSEGIRKLHTKDLLTAVKITCDYDGDLFADDRHIMSCLNYSRADNTRKLLEYGITSYVNQRNQCWNYRYTDSTKNVENYYVNPHHYSWGGDHKIDFTIKEYPESDQDHMFTSLAGVMEFVRQTVEDSPFQHDMDADIYVKLFGASLIYFAYGDWRSEGEPEIFALGKEGHKAKYGAKHYMQKRYDKLQAKFGGYTLIPAASQSPGLYKAGDVIVLETAIDDLDRDELYLICKVETTGEKPEFTIQSLKDYKVRAKVLSSMITFPKIGVNN